MGQEMEDLVQHFIDTVENYAKTKEKQARVVRQYGKRKNDGYKGISSVIDFENFKVRFAYQIDEGPIFKKGIVTLYFNIKDYEYHFCDVLSHVEPNDKDCVVFPYIADTCAMDKCLKMLFEKLDKYEERISSIVLDEAQIKKLENSLKKDIKTFSGRELPKDGPLTLMISGMYSNTSLIRYTSDAYVAYLNGNYKRALKLYSKEETLVLYEKQLLKLMKELIKKGEVYSIPEEQKTINNKKKIKKGTVIYTIISSIVTVPVVYLITLLLYKIFLNVVGIGAEMLIPLSSIFLTVPTVALTIAFVGRVRDKIFKTKLKNMLKFNILYTSRQNKKRIWTNAITIASILVIAIIASSSITLRAEGVKYSKDILDFKGTIVSYNDIEVLDTVSQVIKLKNGEVISLKTYLYDADELNEKLNLKIK